MDEDTVANLNIFVYIVNNLITLFPLKIKQDFLKIEQEFLKKTSFPQNKTKVFL